MGVTSKGLKTEEKRKPLFVDSRIAAANKLVKIDSDWKPELVYSYTELTPLTLVNKTRFTKSRLPFFSPSVLSRFIFRHTSH